MMFALGVATGIAATLLFIVLDVVWGDWPGKPERPRHLDYLDEIGEL